MKKDKLVLADGTEIELEAWQGISGLSCNVKSISAACALWEKFTKENLDQVLIKNSDDLIIARYPDEQHPEVILDHVKGAKNKDGTVQITFSLRNKLENEILTERVETLETKQQALEAEKQTHTEAIEDLGQAMSDIVEGGTN